MKVRTQLSLFVYSSLILIVVILFTTYWGNFRVEQLRQQRNYAFDLGQNIFQLQILSTNYLFDSGIVTDKLNDKWNNQYNNSLDSMRRIEELSAEDKGLIVSIQAELISLRPIFSRLTEVLNKNSQQDIEQQLLVVLRSQLNIKTQTIASEAFQLDKIARESLMQVERTHTLIQLVALFIFAVAILLFSIAMRHYIRNILRVAHSIREVARGNVGILDEKLPIGLDNEIGELSRSFYSLQGSMAEHHAELEKAIQEKTNELTRSLEKEEAQNKQMSKTQKAMINLLEDIAEERERFADQLIETQKFKLAVDAVSEHIVITDPDGIVIYANQAVENITGFPQEEVLGSKAGKLWGGIMKPEFYKEFWHRIKIEKKSYVGIIKNMRKNGEVYQAAVNVSPVVDDSGEVLFFVGIERDVTREQEIDKAKTEFVSLASHQLRTPLSAISWYAEMLLSGDAGKLTKEQREYLEEVYTSNKRMSQLVNSLLNVSRLEMGTFIVEPENIDVVQVAQDILKEFKQQIKEKKHSVVTKFNSRLSKKLNFDPRLLGIIFQNLLSNAIKYTPEGGKIIFSLSTHSTFLVIKVSDNGIGIPVYQKNKIFDKLFRADNVTQTDTDGNGLGLYIVKTIVDQSKGSISFKSTEGKGTTFIVKLPLKGMAKREGTRHLT